MNMLERFYFSLVLVLIFCGCTQQGYVDNFIKIEGKTQGTTYHVSYSETNALTFEKEIDSILAVIDNSLSDYLDSSLISKFNNSDTGSAIDEHILKVYLKSCDIFNKSQGAFDPTVKPLIDFWGFGTEKINVMDKIDSRLVDSIRSFVGMEKIVLYEKKRDTIFEFLKTGNLPDGNYFLLKKKPSVGLNFNAIAQGYTVDVISEFLESNGVKDYLVEIGGELRVKGKSGKGENWKIGIDKPSDESKTDRPLQAVVELKDCAMATSGNYRKFFIKDGVKYSHTIDATTGFPVQQKPTMLSVTVISKDCMSSDGYATAIMALGLEKGKALIDGSNEIEAYLVYDENGEWKSYMTTEFKKILIEKD